MQRRRDVTTTRTLRVAVLLSLLVHALALWLVVPRLPLSMDAGERSAAPGLAVNLAPGKTVVAAAAPPPASSAPAAKAAVVPPAPPPAPRAKTPPKRNAAPDIARRHVAPPASPKTASPPIVARDAPAQHAIVPTPPSAASPRNDAPASAPPVAPPPVAAPPTEDLAAYVEAKRRERGEAPASAASTADPVASDIARRDRIVAANLGLGRTPTFGTGSTNAGGLFQIIELGYDDARFYFFGFDKDIGRNAKQLIEVRRGGNADIRIAIVRRMIAIIRGKIGGDFVWVSQRLGRNVTLSARPEDNAGLEDFILRDVFPDARLP